jgi:hypothetical protein
MGKICCHVVYRHVHGFMDKRALQLVLLARTWDAACVIDSRLPSWVPAWASATPAVGPGAISMVTITTRSDDKTMRHASCFSRCLA